MQADSVTPPCRNLFCNDVCKLDTVTGKCSTGFLRPPFGDKSYHSATLLESQIWVVGGSDGKHTSSQVYVLETKTLKWRTVSIRRAHSCMPMRLPSCITVTATTPPWLCHTALVFSRALTLLHGSAGVTLGCCSALRMVVHVIQRCHMHFCCLVAGA